MFKNLFSKKDIFLENFIDDYEKSSPEHISLDFSDHSLKTVWHLSLNKKIGLEIEEKKLILSNKNDQTKKFKRDNELAKHLTLHIQRAIHNKIEEAKKYLHLFPNISQPSDGELKGEEWLKVTNHVLKESLKKAESDENLLVEAKVFMGKLSSDQDFSIRIQCYNLDYSLIFLSNGKLYLSVFDDKNFERGHSEKPSYNGEFFNNRPAILDEFIKLTLEICKYSGYFS